MTTRHRVRTLALLDEGRRLVELSSVETLRGSVPPLRALLEKVVSRPAGVWLPRPSSLALFHLLAMLEFDPLGQMKVLVRDGGDWKEVRANASLAEIQRACPGPSRTVEFELGATYVVLGTEPPQPRTASSEGPSDEWLLEEDPAARARKGAIEETTFPYRIVFERGERGPDIRFEQHMTEFSQYIMRYQRLHGTSSTGLSEPPMDTETLEELIRLRTISGAYTHGGRTDDDGTVPALRLGRWLHEAATGRADAARLDNDEDGTLAEQRLDAWAAAWASSWRPRLPIVVQAMAKSLPEFTRLNWSARGMHLVRLLPPNRAPRRVPVTGESSSPQAWLSCSLLCAEADPVLELLRSCPHGNDGDPTVLQQSDAAADLAFVRELKEAGGTLSATTESYGGIQIKQIGPDTLRFMIQVPEHLAGTGQRNTTRSRIYAHWPATEIGIQVSSTARVKATGELPGFMYWDPRINMHPLCSAPSTRLASRGGSVCIAASGSYAAAQALEQGFTPGQVAAAQMLEARDVFLMGVRRDNRNGYYRDGYARAVLSEDSTRSSFTLLPEKEAHALARKRKISINDY